MPHTITYNADLQILEVKIYGDYFVAEAKQVLRETAELAKKHHCLLILSDIRDAQLHLSTLEIYEAPKDVAADLATHDIPVAKIKRAVVTAQNLSDPVFLETVVFNRGQMMKLFQDIEAAREWLLK